MKLGAVVVAAGLSRRMGREKVLLRFGDRTVLERVLATLAAAGVAEIVAVMRPDLPRALEIARAAGARIAVNPRPEEEMLLSIRMGIAELSPDIDAFYVWPADHPAVAADTAGRLAREAGRARVILPVHAGRRGHPALVGADLIPEIAAIPEGEGLRHLWRARPDVLIEVPVVDAGTLVDLNTPGDYEKCRPIDTPTDV
ncbi:MAG TPA: nucleotidyltransferase family protein [Thermoanaerobaculia bacterium]|nr:nucleotidyltransferase family protein [Thermoanaerobaculia bacterium]